MKKNLATLWVWLALLGVASCVFAIDNPAVHDFQGKHVLGELYGVEPKFLDNPELLKKILLEGIKKSGATYCDAIVKKFDPHGVTILILVAESHVSIHTYPEHKTLFFDAFTCGNCDPMLIAEALIAALQPSGKNLQVILRGT